MFKTEKDNRYLIIRYLLTSFGRCSLTLMLSIVSNQSDCWLGIWFCYICMSWCHTRLTSLSSVSFINYFIFTHLQSSHSTYFPLRTLFSKSLFLYNINTSPYLTYLTSTYTSTLPIPQPHHRKKVLLLLNLPPP